MNDKYCFVDQKLKHNNNKTKKQTLKSLSDMGVKPGPLALQTGVFPLSQQVKRMYWS